MQAVEGGVFVEDDRSRISRRVAEIFPGIFTVRQARRPAEAAAVDEGLGYAEDARLARLIKIEATGIVARLHAEREDVGIAGLAIEQRRLCLIIEPELAPAGFRIQVLIDWLI